DRLDAVDQFRAHAAPVPVFVAPGRRWDPRPVGLWIRRAQGTPCRAEAQPQASGLDPKYLWSDEREAPYVVVGRSAVRWCDRAARGGPDDREAPRRGAGPDEPGRTHRRGDRLYPGGGGGGRGAQDPRRAGD